MEAEIVVVRIQEPGRHIGAASMRNLHRDRIEDISTD